MTYINKKGRAYKQTAYLQKAFDNHSDPKVELKSDEPKLSMPDSGLEKDLSYKEKFTWESKIKAHWEKEEELQATCRAAYNLMWGQLTPGLQSMISAHTEHKVSAADCDCLWLLERIKIESSGLDIKGNKRVNFFVLILRLFNFKQGKKMSNDVYYNTFLEHVASLEAAGGEDIFCNTKIMKFLNLDPTKIDDVKKESECFKAIMFLLHSNSSEYGGLLTRLENNAVIGQDGYPLTVADAYHLLNRELLSNMRMRGRTTVNQNTNQSRTGAGNLMFLQQMLNAPFGKAVQFVQLISSSWILLDTCSTCCVTNNRSFVHDVLKCNEDTKLTLHTNGGLKEFNEVGIFNMFPLKMHVNTDSLATVLSFHLLQSVEGVRITYDSDDKDVFSVTYNDKCYKFGQGGDCITSMRQTVILRRMKLVTLMFRHLCHYVLTATVIVLVLKMN